MKTLKQLIQELCPEGVEFKKLKELVGIYRGVRLVRKDLETQGYPVYQNSLKPLGYFARWNVKANTPFIIVGGGAGSIGWSDTEFWAADDCVYFTCNDDINSRFLYHFLLKHSLYFVSKVRKASVPRLARSVIEDFEIPVIPIEIQEKIVEILDKFTALTAELQAELQARQQQYEYYRDHLLSVGGLANIHYNADEATRAAHGSADGRNIITPPRLLKMSNLGSFYGGLTGKSKADFTDGNSKFITYMNVFSNISLKTDVEDRVVINPGEKQNTIQYGDVLFTGSSETPEEAGMTSVLTEHVEDKLYLNSFCFGFRLNDLSLFNPEFMKHLFRSKFMRKQIVKTANGVTRYNISKKDLGDVLVPIFPIDEQNRIADILDRFEALVSDLTSGLPAEIAARQQQYEYYRDRLLTFKHIST